MEAHGGHLVDTAGDGSFNWFPSAIAAVTAACDLQKLIAAENPSVPKEHELAVRSAVHYDQVLQDENVVTGDAVNLCARVAEKASGGEVLITGDVFYQLPNNQRILCGPPNALTLKGFSDPV